MKKYNNNEKIIIKLNIKQIIVLVSILLIILGVLYIRVLGTRYGAFKFSSQTEKFALNNEEPIFKVSKIILYSSASAQDKSSDEVLQDMDISQFTDISINIDNKIKLQDITDKNTVKQLYIDNMNIEDDSNIGEKILNYKNPYIFGKFKKIENTQNNRVDFKIVGTNQENDAANYDEPIFYSDCSNPISIGYVNQNLKTRFSVSENKNSITFDGKLLKNAGIKLDDLNCKIKFNIHIINYKNEEFVCPIVIENNLDNEKKEIYQGHVLKTLSVNNEKYNFIQLN